MTAPKSDTDKTRDELIRELQVLRRRLKKGGVVPAVERRKAENQASRKVISDALNSTHRAVFTINIEGLITRASPEFSLITGYGIDELVGIRHTLVFNQEIMPRSIDISAAGFTCKKIFDGHKMEITRKDGSTATVRVSAAPIYEHGRLSGVVGVADDGYGKSADQGIISQPGQHELLFRSVFELSNIGLAITSPEKGWLRVNRAICELLGYSAEELMQKTWTEMTHPDDLEADIHQFEAMLAGEIDRYEMDKRFIRKDGSSVYTHLTVACQRKADEKVDFAIASLLDTGEQKQAELEADKSHERFSTIFNQAPLGIALIDSLSGEIYNVNPRFAEIAGRTVEEMISIDWMSITHPDDVQEDLDNMALVNAGRIPGFQMDKRYIRPDGTYVWIRMTIAPLKSETVESPRHLCMIDDITERKQSEASLARSELRYRTLFECITDYIIVLESQPDGPPIIVDANDAAFEKHGYMREELIGKPITFLDSAVSQDGMTERMKQFTSGKPFRFESEHRRKDGTTFTVEIAAQMLSIGGRELLYTH